MSILIENLKEAIIGESNAKRKYELFAEQAEKEGFIEISRLFKAVAYAESIHIKNHTNALAVLTKSEIKLGDFVKIDEEKLKKIVKDSKSNLMNAITGEKYEFKIMYKGFERNAKKLSVDIAELSFSLARKAEIVHAKLYSRYLKQLIKNGKFEYVEIYVCNICGNVDLGVLPEKCVICGHPNSFFRNFGR